MNLLILGGNSQRNKEWVHQVDSSVSNLFDSTKVHEYRHWSTGEEMLDFDYELDAVAREAHGLLDYGVFAKSVGSILTMTLISQGDLSPKFCVFAGVALKLAKESGIDIAELFEQLQCPVTIIQNDKDPVGGFNEIAALTEGRDDIRAIETRGDDHSYDDLDLIRAQLELNLAH